MRNLRVIIKNKRKSHGSTETKANGSYADLHENVLLFENEID